MKETVDLGDRKVTVLGTAHVSEASRRDVEETIEQLEPDLIGVELDEKRFESLRDENGWKDLDVVEAIRNGKGYLLLLNLILSIYQRRMGMEQGVKPGAEMLEAVEQAEERGTEYCLVDRDINDTFERLRDELGFWDKLRLFTSFYSGEETDLSLEDLKNEDIIGQIVRDLEDDFPTIKQVFLDERNSHMVEKLLEKEFDHAVLVVGAAHLEGIVEELKGNKKTFEDTKRDFIPWMKMFNYGFPLLIISMLGYSFYTLGFDTGVEATTFWVLANGFAALTGAIIARAHVVTWIVAFITSPLTSLLPFLGVGMVAAYVEGRLYPPKVKELEDIAYISSYRDLWGNQVGRIILTFVLVTLMGAAATFIGAGYIASLIATV